MPKFGLIARIALLVIAIEVAAFGTLGAFFVDRFNRNAEQQLHARLNVLGNLIANGEMPISALARTALMEEMLGMPYLSGLAIGGSGRIIAATDPTRLGQPVAALSGINPAWLAPDAPDQQLDVGSSRLASILKIRHPESGALLFTAILEVDTQPLVAQQNSLMLWGGLVAFFFVAVSSAMLVFFAQRFITRRIGRSLEMLKAAEGGDLSARIAIEADDELADLQRGINSMTATVGALLNEAQLYATVFSEGHEASMICDGQNRIIAVNPAFTQLTGYRLDEVAGQNPRLLASGQTPVETYREMWSELLEFDHWDGELIDRRKDGSTYPKWISISVIRDKAGKIVYFIAMFSDISERKRIEERVLYLAHHDKLTGLFNRHSLHDRLGLAVATAERTRLPLAVMFIDMDRFKTINDTLGHAMGDQLLTYIAARLRKGVRESDIVARLGGDEFVVVLTGMMSNLDAMTVANKLLQSLSLPYDIDGVRLHSTPSIGISVYPEDGDSPDLLMKNADTAMYHAKAQGRNNIQFFTDEMNRAATERLELERELRQALDEGQFELHYQPQICTRSGKVCGVEALVRWRHPQRGMVPPFKFIPIAEECGLIEPLGDWVLEQACRQVAAWRDAGIRGVSTAINLSAHQLRSTRLVEHVKTVLDRYRIQPGELELEITESAAMNNPERSVEILQALRDLGIRLAIDDFGTGYSSLAYLRQLPAHSLKIDRSFVQHIEQNKNDAEICLSILALAHSIGLKVVAEGVETEAQRDFLAANGCDYLQGYLFAKPEPAARCQELIQSIGPAGSTAAVPPAPTFSGGRDT